jgi:hypothetical protein
LVLQPGPYWVAVQGDQTNAWGWVERTSQTGSPGVWTTQQDGSPCENVFKPKGDCFATTTPDQVFRLNGTSTPISAPAAPKKKCKKGFRVKTIKKNGKKRKKCVRKKRKRKR